MKINLIPKTNRELIHKCVELVKDDYLDNIVLIGDLFPPCIKLTDIYGVFDNKELISFFTVFKGFKVPSVVLPTDILHPLKHGVCVFLSITIVNFINCILKFDCELPCESYHATNLRYLLFITLYKLS